MGFFNFLDNGATNIAEIRVKKVATKTAKVMLRTATLYTNRYTSISELKPHQFAMASIISRPGWTVGDNYCLHLDGINLHIRFIDGIDIAYIIGFIASTELSTDIELLGVPNYRDLILLAKDTARQYVIQNCNPSLLCNK